MFCLSGFVMVFILSKTAFYSLFRACVGCQNTHYDKKQRMENKREKYSYYEARTKNVIKSYIMSYTFLMAMNMGALYNRIHDERK